MIVRGMANQDLEQGAEEADLDRLITYVDYVSRMLVK